MDSEKKIYFTTDTYPIITEIIRNNLKEDSDDDILNKLSEDKPLQGEIIINATEKIFLGNKKEAEIYSFLQEQLSTTSQTAKQIYKDIKEKLIPLANRESSNENVSPTFPRVKPIINNKKEDIRKMPEKQKPKEPDSYREPIE